MYLRGQDVDGLRYDLATDPETMPLFARAMQEHSSGEIWAGQITMTSGALLASYAMVARDLEFFFLLPTVIVAETVGEVMGSMARAEA